MIEYVAYSNDDEVIVCAINDEHRLLQDFFIDGGRDTDDYNRLVTTKYVLIESNLNVG